MKSALRMLATVSALALVPMTAHAKFLSADPVGFADGGPAHFNAFAYVVNDPINGIDPFGLERHQIERRVTRASVSGSRIKETVSITVESDASFAEVSAAFMKKTKSN